MTFEAYGHPKPRLPNAARSKEETTPAARPFTAPEDADKRISMAAEERAKAHHLYLIADGEPDRVAAEALRAAANEHFLAELLIRRCRAIFDAPPSSSLAAALATLIGTPRQYAELCP